MAAAHKRPRLRIVATPGRPDRGEFAVRFSSATGLSARLRRPLNSFGFVGPGRVSLSPEGLTVNARSASLLGLRQAARFIPVGEIHDVYREGEAVQIHLRGPRRPYLRLWARDAASASELVALLPTRSTIEFDAALVETPARPPRAPLMLVTTLACMLAVLSLLAWLAGYLRPGAPVQGPPPPASTAAPVVQPPLPAPEAAATPAQIRATRADLEHYIERIDDLRAQYRDAYEELTLGRKTPADFADALRWWQLPQWNELEFELRTIEAQPGSLRDASRRDLLEVVDNWRVALRTYAEDRRAGVSVERPFAYMNRAEPFLLAARARLARLDDRSVAAPPPQ